MFVTFSKDKVMNFKKFLEGNSFDAYEYFGAHFIEEKTKVGRKNVIVNRKRKK